MRGSAAGTQCASIACEQRKPETMTDDGSLYRIDGRVYTYGELRDAIMAEVADLPPETWRDGKFDFDDYLIESVLVGTIEEVDDEDD